MESTTEEQQRCLEVLRHAPAPAIVIDGAGTVCIWNPAAERDLGHLARDVEGRCLCDLLLDDAGGPVSSAEVPLCDWAAQSPLDRQGVVDLRFRTACGAVFDARCVLLPLTTREDDADLMGVLPTSREAGTAAAPSGHAKSMMKRLSRREDQVLRLMCKGADTKGIARALFISPATVRNHIQSILTKLEVKSRLQAVVWAAREGLLR